MNDSTRQRAFQPEQPLERGIVGAFQFFIALRLLLWLTSYLLYLGDGDVVAVRALSTQTNIGMLLADSVILLALAWPRLRLKVNQRHFIWILVVSTAVLLFGHASVLLFNDSQELPKASGYFTPYSIFLFTTVLFVAWQYRLRAVLIYGVVAIGLLLLLQLWQFGYLTVDLFAITVFLGLATILLPGWLVTTLMTQQRQQRAALAEAAEEQARTNEQLVHYAASLEELTISRERNRLARELHDTLAHSLSAVTVQLGAVETLWKTSPDAAKALLTQADSSARDGLQEARRALQALRASPLEDLGLVLALEALAEEAATRAGAILHLDVPEEKLTLLEPHIEQSIYRVAQEALENCVRHAQAGAISVTLTHRETAIQLIVRDDGQGFDATGGEKRPTGQDRYGVAGMAERAEMIDGTLTVESRPDRGTTVRLHVPVGQRIIRREETQ